jgi:hypothetical protein
MANIGKRNTLTVVRDSSPGLYLDGGQHGEILLPNRYVPRGIKAGDQIEVFVYLDSEDRLVATTETPRATVGEIATLKVISINRQVGAFLDWGLAKDLLLPFREQTCPIRVGQDVVVRVYIDQKTQRIVASMKLDRELTVELPRYRTGQPVEFLITEKTALGYKALVEGKHSGLLYHDGLSVPITIGKHVKGFVRALRPDGKIDLVIEQPGYRRVAPLALRIVQTLQLNKGRLGVDDDSAPEAIRQAFGVSKKAFKTGYRASRQHNMVTRRGADSIEKTAPKNSLRTVRKEARVLKNLDEYSLFSCI